MTQLLLYLFLAVFSLLSISVEARTTIATDDFNRADNTDLGASWDVQTSHSNLQIVGNRIRTTDVSGATDAVENYNAITLNDNQFACIILASAAGTAQRVGGVILRASSSADTLYDFSFCLSGCAFTSRISKRVSGSFTEMFTESSTTWVATDQLCAEASGTHLTLYRNGSALISTSDSSIASGRAGAVIYMNGGAVGDLELDDWFAGNLDWSSIGTLGSVASETANQSSLVLTTTAACEAANTCVCTVAVDNNGTTDGDEGAVTSITDSASNSWTKLIEFANGQGTAQTGAVVYLAYTKAATTIASSGTITANFSNSTSRDASAMTCWEFSNSLSNYTLSSAGTATLATDGADPGAISISSLTSAEYLWLHALAGEGPTADAYTWDADYTQFSADGTTNAPPGNLAHDAATESSTFTTTSPFTFSHTPTGTPKGVIVAINHGAVSTDLITGTVSYGGVAMSRIVRGTDSTTEPGSSYIYFLGSGIPTGTQTVSITHTGSSDVKIATAITITANGDTESVASGHLDANQANAQIALDSGAKNALRYFAIYYGGSNVTDLTLLSGESAISDNDYGLFVSRVDRQTTQSSGSFTTGYTNSTDDVGMAAIAIAEVVSAANQMHIRGGFRIFTSTTDTVDVTSTTADRDYAQGLVALLATAVQGATPRTLTLMGVGR